MIGRTILAILVMWAGGSPASASPTGHNRWPNSLRVLGSGFPHEGDSCRRLGETVATANYLDDSATLVGCPSRKSASRIAGKVVGEVQGIILVSVPNGDTLRPGDGDGQGDRRVAGTQYNATASVPCSNVEGSSPTCPAGVTRSSELISVEIQLPNGRQRVLLFDGKGQFVTHSSSQSDGSGALQSSAVRRDDWTIVTVGKEQYRIPDAFVLGD